MHRDWLSFVVGCALSSMVAGGASAQEDSECETDADCPMGEECVVVGASVAGCDPAAGSCDDLPPPVEYRGCEPAPLYCDSDDDCPTGLVCDLDGDGDDSGCAVSSDGQMFCPEPDDSDARGECAFELTQCSADSDCGANEECVLYDEGGVDCAAPAIDCAPGEDCVRPEPDCGEPTEVRICFPALIDCEVQEQCPAGWGCFDFANAEDGEPPPWWDDDVATACLPEGLILAAMGAEVGATGDAKDLGRSGTSDDAAGGTDAPSIAEGSAPGSTVSDGDAAGDDGGSGGSGLCAVGPGSPASAALWLLPAIGWLRRRSRR